MILQPSYHPATTTRSATIKERKMGSDGMAVREILMSYQEALNQSDTDAVVRLFASDAVVLAQNAPSSVGIEAIRQTYGATFEAIALSIKFKVEESVPLSPEWVMMRTASNGTIRINATGDTIPEANQELFLFKKVGSAWKIARYAFSTILPAQ